MLAGAIYAAAVSVFFDLFTWVVAIYDLGGLFFAALRAPLPERPRAVVGGLLPLSGLFKESVVVLPLILAALFGFSPPFVLAAVLARPWRPCCRTCWSWRQSSA